MNESRIAVVTRADGETINVVKKRGQLFVCSLGCCSGRTEKGFDPVPQDLYRCEWEQTQDTQPRPSHTKRLSGSLFAGERRTPPV